MARRPMTPEEKAAFGEKMKAAREAKKTVSAEETVEAPVESPEVVEPEQAEEVSPVDEAQPEPKSDKIILHFTKPVEVYINGKPFVGKDVEVPDYSIATEVLRIAREAYGAEIVE